MENKSTVFAAQHSVSPQVRIGVTYEDKGLVVSLYRGKDAPQRFKYYNPSEVTDWFNHFSKFNLEPWRAAYHASPLKGSDFKRPEEKVVTVEIDYKAIPFATQRDNELDASGACNVTAYSRPIVFYHLPTLKNKYTQVEDNLNYWMKENNLDRHDHNHLVKMGRAHRLDCHFETSQSLQDIRGAISRGVICVASTKLTSSGHIVCIIGKQGRDFVVHDSWGDFNSVDDRGRHYRNSDGSWATNGAARIYSEATMQNYLIDKRPGSGAWVHYIEGVLDK